LFFSISNIILGVLVNFLSRILEALGTLRPEIQDQYFSCVSAAIDNLSSEYPLSHIVNGKTFWDNFKDEFILSISNDLIFNNHFSIFAELLGRISPNTVDINQITNRFFTLLTLQIIKHQELFNLLMMTYISQSPINIFNFDFTTKKFVEIAKDKIALSENEIKNNFISYIIAMQHWSMKEVGEVQLERTFISDDMSLNVENANLTLMDIFYLDDNFIILGEPGCGKTYSLKQIVMLCTFTPEEAPPSKIPIYIRLSAYDNNKSIEDDIFNSLNPYLENKLTNGIIQNMLINGSFLLLLDGLDEVRDIYFEKCIENINYLIQHFNKNKIILTCRKNVYNNIFGNRVKTATIKSLNPEQVDFMLSTRCDIPSHLFNRDIYILFGNPLLLEIGINVINKNNGKIPLNRSIMFNEFVNYLLIDWEKEKGLLRRYEISSNEIKIILQNIAFNCFDDIFLDPDKIYEYINLVCPNKNSDIIYDCLLTIGILDKLPDNKIDFYHRTFREYFAAQYIVGVIARTQRNDILVPIINNINWHEVFIFTAGLFMKWNDQDVFLNYILDNNIKLYIDCIKEKNDFKEQMLLVDQLASTKRYLDILVTTYEKILARYFGQIKHLFYPYQGYRHSLIDKQICISGYLDKDREHLNFMFMINSISEPKIIVSEREEIEKYRRHSYRIQTSGVNLRLSNLIGDSGRQIALQQIQSELKHILDKEMLIESKYLIAERINAAVERIRIKDSIKNNSDLLQWLNMMIEKAFKEASPNLVGYNYNGVELFQLHSLVLEISKQKSNYCELLLPQEDIKRSGWVWDLYSHERLKERIICYFKYYKESFEIMVRNNFEELKNYMPDYVNLEYKYIIELYYPKEDFGDLRSAPRVKYYYIPIIENGNAEPEVIERDGDISNDGREILNNIEREYKKRENYIPSFSVGYPSVSIFLVARRGSGYVLCDNVYDLIKRNIKHIGLIS